MKEYNHKDHLKESLKDEEFRKIWEDMQPEYKLMREICEKRIKKQMTQKELSKKTGITQAEQKIKNDRVQGEIEANKTHYEVGKKIRKNN